MFDIAKDIEDRVRSKHKQGAFEVKQMKHSITTNSEYRKQSIRTINPIPRPFRRLDWPIFSAAILQLVTHRTSAQTLSKLFEYQKNKTNTTK
jgi:hypothetical protein